RAAAALVLDEEAVVVTAHERELRRRALALDHHVAVRRAADEEAIHDERVVLRLFAAPHAQHRLMGPHLEEPAPHHEPLRALSSRPTGEVTRSSRGSAASSSSAGAAASPCRSRASTRALSVVVRAAAGMSSSSV